MARVWNLFNDDGLRAALKPVRDGLMDARVIHSDGPRSGHGFVYPRSWTGYAGGSRFR